MTTEPTPNEPTKKIPVLTIVGIVLFFVGAIVARVLRKSDPELGADVGDIVKAAGATLAAAGGALPIPEILRRVFGTGAKALFLTGLGGALVAGSIFPACTTVQGHALTLTLEDGAKPRPACIVHFAIDGQELHRAYVDDCDGFVRDVEGHGIPIVRP